LKIKMIISLVMFIFIVGCNTDNVGKEHTTSKENSDVTSAESKNKNKDNAISNEKKEAIRKLVTNYIKNEVKHNLEALKNVSKGEALNSLPDEKNYENFKTILNIQIGLIEKNEYDVKAAFEAVPKGQEHTTRLQRNFRIIESDGDLYITSIRRTV